MIGLMKILGGVVTALGLLLATFFSFKKAGADAEKTKTLTQEVKDDQQIIKHLQGENAFSNRLRNDPAYLDRMRKLLNDQK